MKMPLIRDRHNRRVLAIDQEPSAVVRIRVLADTNIKGARAAYVSEFGFEVEDKRIDHEIAGLLSVALANGRKTIQLPVHVALALYLREGGGGRTVGTLPATSWSDKKRIIEKAQAERQKLGRGRDALAKAVAKVTAGTKFSASEVTRWIQHPSGKRKKT